MTMTEARQKMWAKKVNWIVAIALKFLRAICSECCTCSPTSGSLEESNGIKSSMNGPMGFWMETCSLMYSTPISDDVALAPDALLKVLKCGCSGKIQCRTNRCRCRQSNMFSVLCVSVRPEVYQR